MLNIHFLSYDVEKFCVDLHRENYSLLAGFSNAIRGHFVSKFRLKRSCVQIKRFTKLSPHNDSIPNTLSLTVRLPDTFVFTEAVW